MPGQSLKGQRRELCHVQTKRKTVTSLRLWKWTEPDYLPMKTERRRIQRLCFYCRQHTHRCALCTECICSPQPEGQLNTKCPAVSKTFIVPVISS